MVSSFVSCFEILKLVIISVWFSFLIPVSDSQQHLNVLRGLALQLQHIVYQENQKCWGKPLGSSNLWQEHVETIKRIQEVANQIEIREVCYMIYL